MIKQILSFILILFVGTSFSANSTIESFHENGKIYPVIVVMTVILLGIFVFLIRQEKKIKQIENEINAKQ